MLFPRHRSCSTPNAKKKKRIEFQPGSAGLEAGMGSGLLWPLQVTPGRFVWKQWSWKIQG